MIEGILVMDKPKGMTSFQVVQTVRRMIGEKKAGHAGTLDPMARGVLPVCLGRATKIVQFLMEGRKTYEGVMTLGVATDTYDAAGQMTQERPVPTGLSLQELQEATRAFTGRILQTPPPFSALKHEGQPLYRLARKGILVEKPPRPVHIFSFEILRWSSPEVTFRAQCSKGTYVRSLVHDLGASLGCGAHLSELLRVESGTFHLSQSVSLEGLKERTEAGELQQILVPVERALGHIPAVQVDAQLARRVMTGQPVSKRHIDDLVRSQGIVPVHGVPYLRLLTHAGETRPEVAEGSPKLVSIMPWPTAHTLEDEDPLRPVKVWAQRDQ